ncbi:hypothetical protein DUNSADRAFT_2595 [Dunaliella salina]|uniref:Smr domain-containing protein n=1 Tax=Dunaliella salina TaxID=3046 RepID=A0ABQ7FW41_DUNSA|nr:hypothetical protein DUNSADRAFT_2595 [Dunaliella salina]|eukprot:KAF5826588.1 hypothetical protein DUNSADRAFT_2595 [Dunaliella salina]
MFPGFVIAIAHELGEAFWRTVCREQDVRYSEVDDRTAADALYKERDACHAKASDAYKRGLHKEAKLLKYKGMRLGFRAKKRARKAADATFWRNNEGRPPNEVDLHGLYVEEALERVGAAINAARWSQILQYPVARHMTFTVGKGQHSEDGIARIRPAVKELLRRRYYLRITEDKFNDGRVHVELLHLSELDAFHWAKMLVSWAVTLATTTIGVLKLPHSLISKVHEKFEECMLAIEMSFRACVKGFHDVFLGLSLLVSICGMIYISYLDPLLLLLLLLGYYYYLEPLGQN